MVDDKWMSTSGFGKGTYHSVTATTKGLVIYQVDGNNWYVRVKAFKIYSS